MSESSYLRPERISINKRFCCEMVTCMVIMITCYELLDHRSSCHGCLQKLHYLLWIRETLSRCCRTDIGASENSNVRFQRDQRKRSSDNTYTSDSLSWYIWRRHNSYWWRFFLLAAWKSGLEEVFRCVKHVGDLVLIAINWCVVS